MLRVFSARVLHRPFHASSRSWNSTRAPRSHSESAIELSSPVQLPPPNEQPLRIESTPEEPTPVQPPPLEPESVLITGQQTAYDIELVKKRVREWSESTAVLARNRADEFTAHTKTTFSQLGAQLNKVTGYEAIEALKKQVAGQEERISSSRQAAREAKVAYDEAVVQRSNSQREVNDLLQRKSNWTDSDVGRFTSLVRQDHLYEQAETRAKLAVVETEESVEREFSELMRSILARYHEEQVWSDKIRSASTYGSLAALALNLFVFVTAIVIVEPWKRRRLAQTFEKKIEEMSIENAAMVQNGMQALGDKLEAQARVIEAFAHTTVNRLPIATPLPKVDISDAPPPPVLVITPSNEPVERMKRVLSSQDAQVAVATSAVVAGVIGWVLRTLIGA